MKVMQEINSIIIGTGSYIPKKIIKNSDFLQHEFYDRKSNLIEKANEEIIKKFEEITGIRERRYVEDELVASDIATFAAEDSISDAGIDPETLDFIIVAHNFGDVPKNNPQSSLVPSLASRVKRNLKINNPNCVAFDLPFGCPGWLQGVILGHILIRSGEANKVLIIGTETLSRVYDPHDIDCMIYSDGAGAVILEKQLSAERSGIITHISRTDAHNGIADLLFTGNTYKTDPEQEKQIYLKMHGHKIYEYAITHVPAAMKECLDKANLTIHDIKYLIIHQANAKMDEAIMKRLLKLYNIQSFRDDFMPMIIQWMGNNSVATIPILLDLIRKNKLEGYGINKNEYLLFASVGAGMNINAMIYKT